MAEGGYTFPDFGHAICYYRYLQVPTESDLPQEDATDLADLLPGLAAIKRVHELFSPPKLSVEELNARLDATVQALDTLLAEFVEQGYQAEMSTRLRDIVNDAEIPWWLHEIFVLLGDLDAVLSFVGNPLMNEDDYETEEEAKANAPAFDFSNPEHRAALSKRVWLMGRW